MALDPARCMNGDEQWEEFLSRVMANHREKSMIQYDYRNSKGELFSCVAPTLAHARRRRNKWIKVHGI